jgi:hypothetical protein
MPVAKCTRPLLLIAALLGPVAQLTTVNPSLPGKAVAKTSFPSNLTPDTPWGANSARLRAGLQGPERLKRKPSRMSHVHAVNVTR